MIDLRALTVKNPHAQLIIDGMKLYEYRTWKPPKAMIMEPFVLHVGKALDKQAQRVIDRAELYSKGDYTFGAGIGIISVNYFMPADNVSPELYEYQFGYCTSDYCAWRISVLEVWDTPIPAKGQLGFWRWQS